MSYYHIPNLYKSQEIFLCKECYALEKVHGTSAHISYKDGRIGFFAGGSKHEEFIELFNKENLLNKFSSKDFGEKSVYIYGEAYGGKLQGMSKIYGNSLKFITFEVKIVKVWLNVPKAHHFVEEFGLEFVHYVKIPATLDAINEQRDADSVQALRNGMGSHIREGVVLRPLEEMTLNNGERLIAKHKRDEFKETATKREINPDRLKILSLANDIAKEWATEERLNHIITSDNSIELDVTSIGKVIKLMIEDIKREGKEEIENTEAAEKEIGRQTALMFKAKLREELK